MKCPCIGCTLENEDKNNETCMNCCMRIDYVNSINSCGSGTRLDCKTRKEPKKLIDLSKFKKIEVDQHIISQPMLSMPARNNVFNFNKAAIQEFNIKKYAGVNVYVSNNGKKQIVFELVMKNPMFRINNSKHKNFEFSNAKLRRALGLKPGKYPIKNVDGMMLVEVGNG